MTNNKKQKIVIVGGVAAGATAAARIRRLDENAEIQIYEKGPYVSFANCGLPYFIAGDITKRSSLLLQTPEGFWSRYRVSVELNAEVISINKADKTIEVKMNDSVQQVSYDKLILAQGGSPIRPDLAGLTKEHVFNLWTIPDMDRLHKHLKTLPEGSPVAVVGGGFVGLEVAEAFAARNLACTVVEKAPSILPHMDAEFGYLAQKELESKGIKIITGLGLASITDTTIVLEDGQTIPAHAVLMSIGVKPNLDLAKSAGLSLGQRGGLAVNEFLQTNDPNIYAAGDMVEVQNRVTNSSSRVPLAGPANRQGRIVAANVVGKSERYPGALGTSVVRVEELTLASTGLGEYAAKAAGFDAQAVYIYKDQHVSYMPGATKVLFKLIFDQKTRRILGGQSAAKDGAEKRIDVIAVALAAGFTVDQLASLDLAYAPPYNSAHDPVNMAAFVAMNHLDGLDRIISPHQLSHNAEPKQIIDLRGLGDWSKGHLQGAIHIPVDELRERLSEIDPKKTVIVYCKDGSMGHIAARILRQNNYETVFNVTGGATVAQLEPSLQWTQD